MAPPDNHTGMFFQVWLKKRNMASLDSHTAGFPGLTKTGIWLKWIVIQTGLSGFDRKLEYGSTG